MWTRDAYRLLKAEVFADVAETPTMSLADRLGCLRDAICALQSLDDLGSEEANRRAWDWMLELEARHRALKKEAENPP